MMNLNFRKLALMALLATMGCNDICAQSGIYACGHIRRTRTTAFDKLRNSGYTHVILFNVDVQADGTLTTDYDWNNRRAAEAGGIICQNGKYVFDQYQPDYAGDVKSLLQAPTSVQRIEICIGGWGNGAYGHIREAIAKYGTGENSVLYKNFKALKEAIPEIVAVNNDQEQDYDVASAVKFHVMMADLGYKTTIAPYMNMSYWKNLVRQLNQQREGACDLVYLQTYGGGAGNNPANWDFGDIPMWVGFDCEASSDIKAMQQKFGEWAKNPKVVGGFFWNYNNENRNVNEWATAVNRIFKTKTTTEGKATFYSDIYFKGYAIDLPVGEFTQAEMALYGIKANDITSLKVEKDYKVTVFMGSNFDGQSRTFTEETKWIGNEWNDKIRSIRVEATPAGIESAEVGKAFGISPNPATTYVTVQKPEAQAQVSIFSLDGACVKNDKSDAPTVTMAVNDLPKGPYIVRTGGHSTKLIVR